MDTRLLLPPTTSSEVADVGRRLPTGRAPARAGPDGPLPSTNGGTLLLPPGSGGPPPHQCPLRPSEQARWGCARRRSRSAVSPSSMATSRHGQNRRSGVQQTRRPSQIGRRRLRAARSYSIMPSSMPGSTKPRPFQRRGGQEALVFLHAEDWFPFGSVPRASVQERTVLSNLRSMILPASSIEDSDQCVLSYHAPKALEITHRFMRL